MRAVRGAITVENNSENEILDATKILLKSIIEENDLITKDMVSIMFSMTKDLDKVFPARAAREMGITDVPLMCFSEIDVLGSLNKCIRIMLYVNTEKENNEMKHIYLRGAKILRPDLTK